MMHFNAGIQSNVQACCFVSTESLPPWKGPSELMPAIPTKCSAAAAAGAWHGDPGRPGCPMMPACCPAGRAAPGCASGTSQVLCGTAPGRRKEHDCLFWQGSPGSPDETRPAPKFWLALRAHSCQQPLTHCIPVWPFPLKGTCHCEPAAPLESGVYWRQIRGMAPGSGC